MKSFFYILFFLLITLGAFAQEMERKIIIVNSRYYFTTIDPEFQIATLHTGKISEPMSSAKLLALPAGRNYAEPINPFSWDLFKGNFYGINFLSHPMNDRNEAIKRFPVTSLQAWNKDLKPIDMIMKSVDAPMLTTNDPYAYVIKKSNTLEHFFYDGIAMNDSSYYMAISNKDEISFWNYDGKKWNQGPEQKFDTENYFSIFKWNNKLYIIRGDGQLFVVNDLKLTMLKKSIGGPLSNYTIIENRDNKSISFVKNKDLDYGQGLDKLLSKKAVKLF